MVNFYNLIFSSVAAFSASTFAADAGVRYRINKNAIEGTTRDLKSTKALVSTKTPKTKSTKMPTTFPDTKSTKTPKTKSTKMPTTFLDTKSTKTSKTKSTKMPTTFSETKSTKTPKMKSTKMPKTFPDIESTTLRTVQSELPNTLESYESVHEYIYLGCFQDRAPDRALSHRIGGNMYSKEECNGMCTSLGYKYSGRQFLGECYCGDSGYDKHGTNNSCNACNSTDVGGYKMCVYESSSPSPTMAPNISPTDAPSGPYVYLGCFQDRAFDRALPHRIDGNMYSKEECNGMCTSLDYKYSGRQFLGECYCGDSGYDKHGTHNRCNACDSTDVGGYKMCVYEYVAPTSSPTFE